MKQFLLRLFNAFKSLMATIAMQRNLRVQTGIAIITIGAGLYYNISGTEWCFVLTTIALVIVLEMINTSFENMWTSTVRQNAAKFKDFTAGAKFFASVLSLVVGIAVFKKYCKAGAGAGELAKVLRSIGDLM